MEGYAINIYRLNKGDISKMKREKRLIINTFENFKYNFKEVTFFEALYRLLAIFIFIPLNYYIINRFMRGLDVHNITNTDLLKFGLSIKGIIYITIIVIISFIAVFIEMGILTYMANKSHKQENVSLLEATINCMRVIPRKFTIYMFFMIFICGIVGPLTGIGLYSSLIRELSVPSFIKIELFKSMTGRLLYGFIILVMIIIILRWILSIPIMIIEDIKLKDAFKNSVKIYKSSKFKILFYIAVWIFINFLIKGLMLLIFLAIGSIVIHILGVNSIFSAIFIVAYLVIFFIGYVVISTVTLPLFISFLVELYYEFRPYKANEIEFKKINEYTEKRTYIFAKKHKRKFTIAVVISFTIFVATIGFAAVFNKVVDKDIKITAHRGSSLKAPENSLSSIKMAIEEKADFVEIDAMTTKDNKVVLFHDTNLKRISGSSNSIKNMTLEEVKAVDNGSYFSSAFKDERIPTLEEVFKVANGKIKLNIELKPTKEKDTLPEEVAKLIKEYNMEDQVVVTSLDYNSIQEFKEYEPLVKIGYILTFGIGDFTNLNIDFISVEYGMAKKELIYAMHALNKEVHVWTVNDADRVEDLAKLGVDNIITDSTEMVDATLKKLKENKDINYLTWFYDGIFSIIRYVQI